MDVRRINPKQLGRNSHGWISPEGAIYSGSDPHSSLINHIYEQFDEVVGIGWIRYLTYPERDKTALAFDWTGALYTDESENIARLVARQTEFSYDIVYCDYGNYKTWHGSLSDFIKFGVRGKRTQFEARLEARLLAIK